jgi:hypothetical protein
VDEECEREIEADHEQEEEAEREEVPKMAPCSKTDWDYDGLVAGRVARAAAVPSSKALGAVVRSRRYSIEGPVYRASIPWSRAVYCTANFVETVKECNGAAVATKEDYLHVRLVRSLLVFEGEGGILLVSERGRWYSISPSSSQSHRSGGSGAAVPFGGYGVGSCGAHGQHHRLSSFLLPSF